MSEQPTDEQIKEFWEWCGWKIEWMRQQGMGVGHRVIWVHPNGKQRLELPPIDLNNLFKYAVPKIIKSHFLTLVQWILRVIDGDDPALALFWALWQVKEQGK